jgi:hypothetical protein
LESPAEIIGLIGEARKAGIPFIRIMQKVPYTSPGKKVWLNSDQIVLIRSTENDL